MEPLEFVYPEEEVLEHPSDVGLKVSGEDFRSALTRLIEAFYSLQLKRASSFSGEKKSLIICGPDKEAVVVRVLSELLYLLQGEGVIFRGRVKEVKEEGGEVCAELEGEFFKCSFSPGDFIEDIKAVTYHKIEVKERDGCRIRVFFDI